MLQKRIIPTLLLHEEALVKTVNFKNYKYVGDPCNTVKIFNELEVDELIFQDISSSLNNKSPNLKILNEISNECFMPLGYGGGISSIRDAKAIFEIGFEKICLNTSTLNNPYLIQEISEEFGSQSVIASIDISTGLFSKKPRIYSKKVKGIQKDPLSWALEVESLGAGELLLTSVNNEGTWSGFDLELIRLFCNKLKIPIIANGGAGNLDHIKEVFDKTNASAVGVGSMVVYQKQGKGVLVNFPSPDQLKYKFS